MEVSGQLHDPATLPQGPPYTRDRKPGGPQSRSAPNGKEENSLSPPRRETNLDCPARNQVTILTELPQLLLSL